jgi:hypothetical protein
VGRVSARRGEFDGDVSEERSREGACVCVERLEGKVGNSGFFHA